MTINQATLNGTRVMMDLPTLNGFRRDGRPYEVRARSGIQDIRTPKIIELIEIDATVQTAEGASIRVVAPAGVFDSGTDKLKLNAGAGVDRIRITSTEGYDALMRSAEMDFKRGDVHSKEPVEVTLKNGAVNADSLEILGLRTLRWRNAQAALSCPAVIRKSRFKLTRASSSIWKKSSG